MMPIFEPHEDELSALGCVAQLPRITIMNLPLREHGYGVGIEGEVCSGLSNEPGAPRGNLLYR